MTMWTSIKPVLVGLFSSKKFLVLLAGALVWLLSKGGLAVTEADVTPLLYLVGAYLGAQGLADFRKEGDRALADSLGKSRASLPDSTPKMVK